MAVTQLPQAGLGPARPVTGLGRKWVKFSHLGPKGRISLYKRMRRFAERGMDEKFALTGMHDRFAKPRGLLVKKPDERLPVWRDWLRGLANGQQFSTMIGPYIPAAETLAISAGEETGNRALGYEMAAFVAGTSQRIRGAIWSALFYPGVLMLALILLFYFAAYFLMPAMLGIAPLERWPPIPRALYDTSAFVRDWGWLVMLLFIALVIVIARSLPKWRGPVRTWLDKRILPFSAYRVIQGANVLVVLGALTAGGNPVDESVRRIRRISSPWLRIHLDGFLARLSAGKMPSVAMDTGLLDEEIIGDLQDYDRAHALTSELDSIGKEVAEDSIARIGLQSTLVRYLIMFAFVIGILWIYGSMALLVMSMRSGAPV